MRGGRGARREAAAPEPWPLIGAEALQRLVEAAGAADLGFRHRFHGIDVAGCLFLGAVDQRQMHAPPPVLFDDAFQAGKRRYRGAMQRTRASTSVGRWSDAPAPPA